MDLLEVPYEDLLRGLEFDFWAFLVAVFGWEVDIMVQGRNFGSEITEGFEGLRGWRMKEEDEDEIKVAMVLEATS